MSKAPAPAAAPVTSAVSGTGSARRPARVPVGDKVFVHAPNAKRAMTRNTGIVVSRGEDRSPLRLPAVRNLTFTSPLHSATPTVLVFNGKEFMKNPNSIGTREITQIPQQQNGTSPKMPDRENKTFEHKMKTRYGIVIGYGATPAAAMLDAQARKDALERQLDAEHTAKFWQMVKDKHAAMMASFNQNKPPQKSVRHEPDQERTPQELMAQNVTKPGDRQVTPETGLRFRAENYHDADSNQGASRSAAETLKISQKTVDVAALARLQGLGRAA